MPWLKVFDDIREIKSQFAEKDPILLKIGDRKISLVFYGDDAFAFENKCPHSGAPLHKGHCNDNMEIVCPLHFYQFDLRSGREGMGRNYELNTFPVKIDNFKLSIRLKD